MPLIYLDTSVYNRPFDDQTQPRIWLESQALSIILRMIERGEMELATSSVVSYETSVNPYPQRRKWVTQVIARLSAVSQAIETAVVNRSKELEQWGFKELDALHVACAEAVGASYLVTSDDRLIRSYRRLNDQRLTILDPIAFVQDVAGEKLE